MKIYQSVSEIIGNTPLLRLSRLEKAVGSKAVLLAKMESANPAGSAKDRIAKQMILDAEKEGLLKPGYTIIEPTSGNTGIGLASLAAERGYKAIFTMPETMSLERRLLLQAYGAKIILTKAEKGMAGAIEKAEELHREDPESFLAGQFDNPSNSNAHYLTTGPEIWEDTDGKIDLFISCVGTGGTITGTGRYLKEHKNNIKVVAVEPENSAVLSGEKPGPHGIQGIGAGFVPSVLDTKIYDEIFKTTEEASYEAARLLATTEGVLCGISSGAALSCAISYSKKDEFKGKVIVLILPDTGERYLSTPLFQK